MSRIREMLPGEYGLLDEFLYQAIHTEPGEPRPPRGSDEGSRGLIGQGSWCFAAVAPSLCSKQTEIMQAGYNI